MDNIEIRQRVLHLSVFFPLLRSNATEMEPLFFALSISIPGLQIAGLDFGYFLLLSVSNLLALFSFSSDQVMV